MNASTREAAAAEAAAAAAATWRYCFHYNTALLLRLASCGTVDFSISYSLFTTYVVESTGINQFGASLVRLLITVLFSSRLTFPSVCGGYLDVLCGRRNDGNVLDSLSSNPVPLPRQSG